MVKSQVLAGGRGKGRFIGGRSDLGGVAVAEGYAQVNIRCHYSIRDTPKDKFYSSKSLRFFVEHYDSCLLHLNKFAPSANFKVASLFAIRYLIIKVQFSGYNHR